MRISDWRSDVCSSDLIGSVGAVRARRTRFVMLTVALAAVPVTAPVAAMLPPGAPPPPITQIAAAERMAVAIIVVHPHPRSEESSGGKECVSQCRFGWSAYH